MLSPIEPTGLAHDVCTLVLPAAAFEDHFCVYRHDLLGEQPRTIFYGVCKLREAFGFPDARMNTEWRKIVTPETPLGTAIVFTAKHLIECQNYRYRMIVLHKPHCNLNGTITQRGGRVVCDQTGQVFETLAEAARTYELNPGALSNHVNGKPGFKSVKGKTFSRLQD